jgi:hypothetical protein
MPEMNEQTQAKIDLLRSLHEQGLLSEEDYSAQVETLVGQSPGVRAALAAPGVDSDAASRQPPSLSDLRKRLNQLDDPQIEALAIERFSEVKAKFSDGMRRDAKINLLLDHCRRNPEVIPALTQWLDRQPVTCDPVDALACYLNHIIEANRRLRLQGIRSAGQLVSIDLEEIYVTLTATERRTIAAEEAWVGEVAHVAPGEMQRMARLGIQGRRETVTRVKVKVQEALAAHPRLVVLGDPGSGKTTLLRYLALTFARDYSSPPSGGTGGGRGLVKERLQLDEQRLPIMLPLRDFARYLEANFADPSTDGPKLLLDYLHTYFANQDILFPSVFSLTGCRMASAWCCSTAWTRWPILRRGAA